MHLSIPFKGIYYTRNFCINKLGLNCYAIINTADPGYKSHSCMCINHCHMKKFVRWLT